MMPTLERTESKLVPESEIRSPLVLVHFDAGEEVSPSLAVTTSSIIKQTRTTACKPLADRLYEYGIIAWMVSIVAAIAACLTRL